MIHPVITPASEISPASLCERYGKHSSRVLIVIDTSVPMQSRLRYRIWFFADEKDRIRFCEDYENFIVTKWPA